MSSPNAESAEIAASAEQPTALYRWFDADGGLLYVGVSLNPPARASVHASREWWRLVSSCSVDWYPSRSGALEAETRAIREEEPLANLAGTARYVASLRQRREPTQPPRITVNVRFPRDDLDRVDAAMVRHRRTTRSDMIRVLVLEALEAREAKR